MIPMCKGWHAGRAAQLAIVLGSLAIMVALTRPDRALALSMSQDMVLLESVTVEANQPVPVTTGSILETGVVYQITVTGTFDAWNPAGSEGVDAIWCYAPSYCGGGQVWDQLRIDGRGLSEIQAENGIGPVAYNPEHSYTFLYEGSGEPLELVVSDAQVGYGGDNGGGFTVDVYTFGQPPVQTAGGEGASLSWVVWTSTGSEPGRMASLTAIWTGISN